jgi:hypothetical protein
VISPVSKPRRRPGPNNRQYHSSLVGRGWWQPNRRMPAQQFVDPVRAAPWRANTKELSRAHPSPVELSSASRAARSLEREG